MYSTRPKRGPIEATRGMGQRASSTSCIPRVLSVAPLKQYVARHSATQAGCRIPRVLSVAPLKRVSDGESWMAAIRIPRVLSVAPLKQEDRRLSQRNWCPVFHAS